MGAILGRYREVGIGIQSDYDTVATSATWIDWDAFDPSNQWTDAKSDSANGKREMNTHATRVRENSTPSIEFKAMASSLGIILKSALGSVSTSADTPEAGVNTHNFSVSKTGVYLSIFYKDSNTEKVLKSCMVDTVSIQFMQEDYVKVTVSLLGQKAVNTSQTPAYTDDTYFTGPMTSVKLADTVAGLAGASAVYMQEATLEIKNNIKQDEFYPLGSKTPSDSIYGSFEANLSITRVKTDDTTLYDAIDSGTNKAVRITVTDTNTTIGASSNPIFELELAPSRLGGYSESIGKDDVMGESCTISGIYSSSDSKTTSTKLINTTTSY